MVGALGGANTGAGEPATQDIPTVFELEVELLAYELDLNEDGRLSRLELLGAGLESWMEPGRKRPLAAWEWQRALALDFQGEIEALFAIFDVDASGDWSREELPRDHAGPLLALDRDGNNRVSAEELRHLPELMAFDAYSLQDPTTEFYAREAWLDGLLEGGSVLLPELSETALEELRDYDFNRDGRLTRAEVERGELWLDEPVRFRVKGDVARAAGLLTSDLDNKLDRLFQRHPEVRVLELAFVPGTIDEDVVLEAGRRLQARGIVTRVPAGGMVASGGVTLLACGAGREVGEGARVGVHSWSYRLAGMTLDGRDHPRTSFEHARTLAVYRELGIPEGLYWFALLASDSGGLHWMTRAELDRYGFTGPAAGR